MLVGHCYGYIHREIQAGLFTYPTSPVPCGAWTVIGVSALPMRRCMSVEDIGRLLKSVCKPVAALRKRLRELLMREVEVGASKANPTIITKGGQNGKSS